MSEELTRLELPADISSLQRFTEFVRRGAEAAAFSETDLRHLELVLEEIVVNVVRYAYPEGERGTIEVGYVVEGGTTLFVQVSDTGRAFDPLAKDPPDLRLSLTERPIGGLGIYLLKQFARSINYGRIANRNVFTFRLGAGN